jgi:hypothetical protein
MAAGGGDLQGTFGRFLALDRGQVRKVRRRRLERRLRRCEDLRSLEMVDQRDQ